MIDGWNRRQNMRMMGARIATEGIAWKISIANGAKGVATGLARPVRDKDCFSSETTKRNCYVYRAKARDGYLTE